ncbi:aldo/keto reductase [Actinoallomurus rhizosphaericola]|uniref:aldo/keto reductase n=1 Tax=Actinoallomurus rhizosphaericola TaxID=2952536 RepID=UPI00209226F1|nr:aldo/keto reductase [Actinoallomurus rhizosphaericola]MCO5997434.1 aldo/keto reductase [Actinoallomurus rhizosphaericola]
MTETTFTIGGDLTVNRLGYGAMRITGPGIWGPPADRNEALRVLRRAVELGVDFVDTANSYGPYVSEELIHEALHPYEGVTIATKAGLVRTGPDEWYPVGRPKYLRQEALMSLRRLGLERIDLFQLHRIDPEVPLADQLGELRDLQQEGRIRHIGLSEVSVEEIERAREIVPIVTVQNLYNLTNRQSEDVLDYCEREGIGFIPWFPLAVGRLAQPGGRLDQISKELDATPSQVALAWLLRRSPVMLPIPGTGSVEHLEENMGAANITLTDEQFTALSEAS